MNRFISLCAIVFVACVLFVAPARAANTMASDLIGAKITMRGDYTIFVDGAQTQPDVPPVEKDGLIYIPIRFAAEAMKADVTWNPGDQTVTVVKGGRSVRMKMNAEQADVGGKGKRLAGVPFLYEGRAMIPLKATAQSLDFIVREEPGAAMLESITYRGHAEVSPPQKAPAGVKEKNPADFIKMYREKSKKDAVTKMIRPYVLGAWIAASLFWLFRVVTYFMGDRHDGFKDKVLIGLILFGLTPFVLKVTVSAYWAMIVSIGTASVGLFSTEEYVDKLVTMGSVAQGFGLIMTLLGLGLVIGPAIAVHDIAAIGFGIYVKIEPTITGLTLSIVLATLTGYESRKIRNDLKVAREMEYPTA